MTPSNAAVDAVCWDWNGTLLDDVDVARAAMNSVLRERQLPILPDRDAYREAFGFPIHAFYTRLGVADTDFAVAATRYLEIFAARVGRARLQPGAAATLSAIEGLGVEQVLISATIDDTLQRQLAPHSLGQHFARILGIVDAYAASKTAVVADWLASSGHDPRRVLMVGDTNHDQEIAEQLHVRFLRFAHGHQKPPSDSPHPVLNELGDVVHHVNRPGSAMVRNTI